MKLATILIAALVGATGVAATPAAAQDRVVVRERVVVPARTDRIVVRERTTRYRSDRGRHYGWRNHNRRICTVRYRHGERIRTCRYRRY